MLSAAVVVLVTTELVVVAAVAVDVAVIDSAPVSVAVVSLASDTDVVWDPESVHRAETPLPFKNSPKRVLLPT